MASLGCRKFAGQAGHVSKLRVPEEHEAHEWAKPSRIDQKKGTPNVFSSSKDCIYEAEHPPSNEAQCMGGGLHILFAPCENYQALELRSEIRLQPGQTRRVTGLTCMHSICQERAAVSMPQAQ